MRCGVCVVVLAGLVAANLVGCAGPRNGVPAYPHPIFATKLPDRAPLAIRPAPVAEEPEVAPAVTHQEWIPAEGISDRWTDIVIHHSGTPSGGADCFDRHHRTVNHWDELGYHFVIGNGTNTPDGCVEVGSRWEKQKHGAHCKTDDNYFNDHGVGICLVGNFDQTPPTEAQLTSLEELVTFLMDHCSVPASRVNGHCEITHRTACPGRLFPLEQLRCSLRQGGDGYLAKGSTGRQGFRGVG